LEFENSMSFSYASLSMRVITPATAGPLLVLSPTA
jgi:hypothetical protein